jgi:hypothetical protein
VQIAGSGRASHAASCMGSQIAGGVGQLSPEAVLSGASAQGASAAASSVSCQDPDAGGTGAEGTPPLSPAGAQGGRGSGGVSPAGLVSPLSPSGWRADAAVAAAAAGPCPEQDGC